MKGFQAWFKVMMILFMLTSGLVMPLVSTTRYLENNVTTIAYEFLNQVAGLNVTENDVMGVNFLEVPDTSCRGAWNCTRIKMHLADESWPSMLIRFNSDGYTIDDVVSYSIELNRSKSQEVLEVAVRSFLSRSINRSVRYRIVYQQALQILNETGVFDGAEAMVNDTLYTVSKKDNELVLTWTKTVGGISGLSQNYWQANNIQLSVNSENCIVFFGNTWDKYGVGSTTLTVSEDYAKNIALNSLDEERRGLVNTTYAELFYRRGEGRDPACVYPCWKVVLVYTNALSDGAKERIALIWADTAQLWYNADQGSYSDTSCTMACPYNISDAERAAQINVTQHMHSILEGKGYNDTYMQWPYEADIVASAEAPLYRYAVYFDGHGNYDSETTPDGQVHVYILDSNGEKVWDYEIYNQTTGFSNLVFFWSCYGAQGNIAHGNESGYAQTMAFAFSNRTDLPFGYYNPDHKGFVFLAFIYTAPYFINELDGVTEAGKKFVTYFYDGLYQGKQVNKSLDYASNTIWGVNWPQCWLYEVHYDVEWDPQYPETPSEPPWGGMRCYGDGSWTLYEDPPAAPCRPDGSASAEVQTAYGYSTSSTDPHGYDLRYEFDWGDGTSHTLTGFYPSGQNATASHSWSLPGTYNVSVQAFTVHGGCSDWSPNLTVTVYQRIEAMKTLTNGYFYIPNWTNVDILKIESLFNNSGIEGDQNGGSSPYPGIYYWPDGTVNMQDYYFMSSRYMKTEGEANWDYMADCVPDRIINMQDLYKVTANFMNSGSYSTDLNGVVVVFNTGENRTLDANGCVEIPQDATSFTVYNNSNPIGAIVTFWQK